MNAAPAPHLCIRDFSQFRQPFTVPSFDDISSENGPPSKKQKTSQPCQAHSSFYHLNNRSEDSLRREVKRKTVASDGFLNKNLEKEGRRFQVDKCLFGSCNSKEGAQLLQVPNVPWVVEGFLKLWNKDCFHVSSSAIVSDCLALSDETGTICCSMIDIDPLILGKLIRITSFNYVFSCGNDGSKIGSLEIHAFKTFEEIGQSLFLGQFPSVCISPSQASARSSILESPELKVGKSKAKTGIKGRLHCVGPSFMVPSKRHLNTLSESNQGPACEKTKRKEEIMKGFLVEMVSCNHGSSNDSDQFSMVLEGNPLLSRSRDSKGREREGSLGCFANDCIHVYFSGSPSFWRPVLVKALGKCLAITGLHRKMVLVGPERSKCFIFVATTTTLISMLDCVLPGKHELCCLQCDRKLVEHCRHDCQGKPVEKYNGNFAIANSFYVGTISKIHFEGRLVEVDNHACLLLTHHQLNQISGLRVGAILAIYNVHVKMARHGWEKYLLLGACSRTSVKIVAFSPFHTPTFSVTNSLGGALYKKIEQLRFESAFWFLQVIISFGKKFHQVYSDTEILGTKKFEGMVYIYAKKYLDSFPTIARDGMKEFLCHDKYCSLGKSCVDGIFSQGFPALHRFSNYVRTMAWVPRSVVRNHKKHFFRQIIPSEILHVVLLGRLQVSSSSGRLELADGTGTLDVVVPDFCCLSSLGKMYEISDYNLVIEGFLNESYEVSQEGKKSFHFFGLDPSVKVMKKKLEEVKSFTCYVIFHMGKATQLQERSGKVDNVGPEGIKAGRHHVFLLTHKSAITFQETIDHVKVPVFSAEAVVLPLYMYVSDGHLEDSQECDKTLFRGHITFGFSESSSAMFASESSAYLEEDGSWKFGQSFLKEDRDDKVRADLPKVVLQFRGEHIHYNQVLHIGGYYMISGLNFYFDATNKEALSSCRAVLINKSMEITSLMFVSAEDPICLQKTPLSRKSSTANHDEGDIESLIASGFCSTNQTKTWHFLNKPTHQSRNIFIVQKVEGHVHRSQYGSRVPMDHFNLVDRLDKLKSVIIRPTYNVKQALLEVESFGISNYQIIDQMLKNISQSNNINVSSSSPSEGPLISFYGQVESVVVNSCISPSIRHATSQEILDDADYGVTLLTVRDLKGLHVVNVHLDLRKSRVPLGMGPGIIAFFHRILVQRSPEGRIYMRSIATTLVSVQYISEWLPWSLNDRKSLDYVLHLPPYDQKPGRMVDKNQDLICNLKDMVIQVERQFKIRCRVVGVLKLVLRWQEFPARDFKDMLYCIQFMMGCFLVDDGSGLAECWATGNNAATLFGISEIGRMNKLEINSTVSAGKNTSYNDLCMLIQQHGQIIFDTHASEGITEVPIFLYGKEGEIVHEKERLILLKAVERACQSNSLNILCRSLETGEDPMPLEDGRNQHYYDALVPDNKCGIRATKYIKVIVTAVEPYLYVREIQKLYNILTD